MSERMVVFDCRGDALVGMLHEPDGQRCDLAVLIVVGGPQYRVGSHRQFVLMSRRLADAGYAVLRFDYRGMGDSTGSPRAFEVVDDDIRAAMDALSSELPGLRGAVIFGLCDAASAALMYCCSDARVRGLVLANPWVRTEAGQARTYVRHYYSQRLLTRTFWTKVFSGRFRLRDSLRSFLSTIRRLLGGTAAPSLEDSACYIDRMRAGLAGFSRLGRPVLLLMSERDLTAREFDELCHSSSEWTAQTSAANMTRVDLPGADHTFSSAISLQKATGAMTTWLSAFVPKGRN
jgi:exosortase A-associated hydrolase 1